MSFCQFNRQEKQKAKERYSKEKYYLQNKNAVKEKVKNRY